MRNSLRALALTLLGLAFAGTTVAADHPRVKMQTSMGDIVLELYPEKTPATVENFLGYVREGFYDGTIFHRVIDGFMIQGGGHTADMARKSTTRPPIQNEADKGLKNEPGTLAMARTSNPHSATAQFFINTADNAFLDFRERSVRGWGYTAFGRVVDGMDVVNRIGEVATGVRAGQKDVPQETVLIENVTVIEE